MTQEMEKHGYRSKKFLSAKTPSDHREEVESNVESAAEVRSEPAEDTQPTRGDGMEGFFCDKCGESITSMGRMEHNKTGLHLFNCQHKGEHIYHIRQSNKGFSMLKNIGWNEGEGLGKNNQGILDPIKPVFKKDRKGVGKKPTRETSKKETPEQKEPNIPVKAKRKAEELESKTKAARIHTALHLDVPEGYEVFL